MTHNTREVEEVNYETRDYDGIRWIRYDHYEHALHHQLQKAREELQMMWFSVCGEITGKPVEETQQIVKEAMERLQQKIKSHHSEPDQDVSSKK